MSQHTARLPYHKLSSKAFMGLVGLSETIKKGPLGARLAELVFLRVSQINGCAYCMDMHWTYLVKDGMDPRHLNAVAGWREAPFFGERERAAFRWAEIITATPHSDASDEEYAKLQTVFDEAEISELGFAIGVINAWNLINAGMRAPIPQAG
ncbi:AhpD family alkylhydroperoxidase [Acidovorax sp. 94]|uniref:carboxymuconolactone decarboxylase family protein n=1 Tax=Acidovorax sp. 94 TaxID=2135633 RepID=UPI000EB4F170|nr:carboxymuconolactone decarboxylase family protein [Acidovorax sp. 94]RKR69224.1 AhpD family alkylhydroperoxidase [Acidovorax sp. 94]